MEKPSWSKKIAAAAKIFLQKGVGEMILTTVQRWNEQDLWTHILHEVCQNDVQYVPVSIQLVFKSCKKT